MNILIALLCILAAVTCELKTGCDETKARTMNTQYESTCLKYLAERIKNFPSEGKSETCSVVLQYAKCATDVISTTCGADYATEFLKRQQHFEILKLYLLPISELDAIPECRALMNFVGWQSGEAENVEIGQLQKESTLCPQSEWKSLMQAHITDGNATASANDIQAALRARHPGRSFSVKCYENKVNEEKDKLTKVRPKARGNRYCVVIKNNLWCLADAP